MGSTPAANSYIGLNENKADAPKMRLRSIRRPTCVDCGDDLPRQGGSQRCHYCNRTFEQFLQIRKVLRTGEARAIVDIAEASGVPMETIFKLVQIGYLRQMDPAKVAERLERGCEVCRRPTNGETLCRGCRDRLVHKRRATEEVVAASRAAIAEAPEPVLATAEVAATTEAPAAPTPPPPAAEPTTPEPATPPPAVPDETTQPVAAVPPAAVEEAERETVAVLAPPPVPSRGESPMHAKGRRAMARAAARDAFSGRRRG